MPPKLLIVDDEADIRRMLRMTLDRQCQVIEASNGLDALRLVKKEKPQLMLLDISMPDMDGISVLAAALELVPSITVMMLTGDTEIDTAVRALDCGARAYITKPFDPDYLCAEVERLLEPAAQEGDAPWRVRDAERPGPGRGGTS
jgi:DNA-binding NtrC family response regulator